MIINPKTIPTSKLQNLLQHAIAPRPIALVSTIDRQGNINLSPFSFFNLFSANPPIVIFSPARRVRDNTTKHTLDNLYDIRQCVINTVSYDILPQAIHASADHPKNVNEFEVSGLTMEPSIRVTPPGVKESQVRLECHIKHVYPLGKEAGAGNLVLAEIVLAHFKDELLDMNNDPIHEHFDLIGRLGGDWYCRLNSTNLFEMHKP